MFDNFDIWNCLCKIFDSFIIVILPFCIFPRQRFIKNKWLFFSLAFFITSILMYGIDMIFYPVPFQLTLFIQVVIGMLYATPFFNGPFYAKMVVQCASLSCLMFTRFSSSIVMSLFTESAGVFSFSSTIAPVAPALLISWFFIRFATMPNTRIPSYYGVSMGIFMLFMALIPRWLRSLNIDVGSRTFSLGLFAVPTVIVLYLYFMFFRLIKEYEEKHEYRLLAQRIDTQKTHLDETIQTYNDMRKLRHELENHVFYMDCLLAQDRLSEMKAYFKKVFQQKYMFDMLESGNNAINAFLNQKVAFARAKNIDVVIDAALPEEPGIEESEICAVISNLFDNAIDACNGLTNPEITVTLQPVEHYILIECKNTVAFDVLKENTALRTTKRAGDHGIGLQVVRNIVTQYDGMADFRMEELTFIATVMLKNVLEGTSIKNRI